MVDRTVDIEQIVQQVFARLENRSARDEGPVEATSTPATGRQLVLSARLVTLSELEGHLAGVTDVIVPSGAVVTPAARDCLYENNITLGYSSASAPAGDKLTLALAAADTTFDPAGVIQALTQQGITVQRLTGTGLVGVVAELADLARRREAQGVLLTDVAAPALCLANRHRGVRAVGGTDAASVQRSAGAVGANLLVLEPAGMGFFELKRAIQRFTEGQPRRCPEAYRGVLC